jgi:hypothetical protein
MKMLQRVEWSRIAEDGETIELGLRFADCGADGLSLWAGYADTLSILLGSLAQEV